MPYIKPEQRPRLDNIVRQLEAAQSLSPGEMNYLITRFLMAWLPTEPGYADYSRVRAVLQDVSDEFYRRLMIPYEDYKIALNGDVFAPLPPWSHTEPFPLCPSST